MHIKIYQHNQSLTEKKLPQVVFFFFGIEFKAICTVNKSMPFIHTPKYLYKAGQPFNRFTIDRGYTRLSTVRNLLRRLWSFLRFIFIIGSLITNVLNWSGLFAFYQLTFQHLKSVPQQCFSNHYSVIKIEAMWIDVGLQNSDWLNQGRFFKPHLDGGLPPNTHHTGNSKNSLRHDLCIIVWRCHDTF